MPTPRDSSNLISAPSQVAVVGVVQPVILQTDATRGDQGPVGPPGPTGPIGPAGPQGQGVSIEGSVANYAALPTTGNTLGDVWITLDTGHGWSWDGVTPWNDIGPFRGPIGPMGPTGPQGVPGNIGPTGPQGLIGPTGPQGNIGATGQGYTWHGPWNVGTTYHAYDTVSQAGSSYVSLTTNLGINPATDGGINWQIIAQIGAAGPQGIQGVQGPIGPTGPEGQGIVIKGTVANTAALPSTGNTVGDLWITADTGHGHVWQTNATWLDVGPIQGPAGPAGVPGAAGATGPAGPNAVSLTGANNKAQIAVGDSLIWVPGTAPGGTATAAQVVSGDDPRLSNPRTPSSTLAHAGTHTAQGTGTDLIPVATAALAGLCPPVPAASTNAGTAPRQVVMGDDTRLSDSRNPLVHHLSHITGGTDIIPAPTTTASGLVPLIPNDVTKYLDGTGNWSAPPHISETLNVFIEAPSNKTYTLELDAGGPYTITKLSIKTISGTCTAALQRNGTSITGATAVAVTSTITAIVLNQAVVAGDTIALVISAGSTPVDLSASVRRQF